MKYSWQIQISKWAKQVSWVGLEVTSTSMSLTCEKLTREQPALLVESWSASAGWTAAGAGALLGDLIGFSFGRSWEWTSLGVTYQGNENWENRKQSRCEDSQDRDCLLKERTGSSEGDSKSHLLNEQQTKHLKLLVFFSRDLWAIEGLVSFSWKRLLSETGNSHKGRIFFLCQFHILLVGQCVISANHFLGLKTRKIHILGFYINQARPAWEVVISSKWEFFTLKTLLLGGLHYFPTLFKLGLVGLIGSWLTRPRLAGILSSRRGAAAGLA